MLKQCLSSVRVCVCFSPCVSSSSCDRGCKNDATTSKHHLRLSVFFQVGKMRKQQDAELASQLLAPPLAGGKQQIMAVQRVAASTWRLVVLYVSVKS